MKAFMQDRWAHLLAIIICLVTIILIVSTRNPDCVEVCAKARMVVADREQGCAVACFCKSIPRPREVEFEVTTVWGTRLLGRVHLGFNLTMGVLVKLPFTKAPEPGEEGHEEASDYLRELTIGKAVYIDVLDSVLSDDGYWLENPRIDIYTGWTGLAEAMVDAGHAVNTWGTTYAE